MDVDGNTSPQPDQYARDNGLSIDSHIDPFSLVLQINDSVPQLTPDAGPDGLTSDSCLPPLHLPTVDLREQLDVPEVSSSLVAGAVQYDDIEFNGQYDLPLAQYETRKRLSSLKLDPPALFSDPDYDCCELAKSIQKQRRPNISPEMFPFERLNIENDEGLEFPISARQFGQQFGYTIRREKLDVPKEAMYQLARALQDDWSSYENSRLLEGEVSRQIVRLNYNLLSYLPTHMLQFARDLAVTPPLSPCMEHEEYFIPDAEACEVPFASDFSSMLSDDLQAAESAILQKEFDKDVSPILDIDTPVLSPLLDSPALGRDLHKISSIRMESPLLPITSPLRSTNEEPRIPALLKSMDVDHTLSHPKSSEMDVLQIDVTNGTFDHNLERVMKQSAAAVLKSIEQEHISIAGAIARVEVPVMDFSIAEPEWQILPMDPCVHLRWLYDSYSIAIPPCLGESRADSELRWVPFLQKIDMQTLTKEAIDYDDSLSQLLNPPDAMEVPTSVNFVWKRPGFAVLCEPESEEDVEDIKSPASAINDLASLARKRRFENSSIGTLTNLSPSSTSSVEPIVPLRQILAENAIGQKSLLPSMESHSAVSTLLSNYIDIRTAKRRKQDKSLFFLPTSKPEVELQSAPTREPSQPQGDKSSLYQSVALPQTKVTPPTPCPMTNISDAPTKLIKGLTLGRGLFSVLEQLYPTAEIIERDFGRWNTVAWSHYSVLRSTVVSPLAAEADVIVSPATGIIVTTLLKAIQEPLPAHGGRSSIRERIACVALRYERLIVLVSEGNVIDETVRDLAPSEATAYAEFVIFVTSLNCNTEVLYVGGGEATLARWLVSCVVQYAPEAAATQEHIIQDETMWEVFLRRAGFNAYAAQAILVRLQARNNNPRGKGECTKYGLAAFMLMTDVERMQNLRDLMGGESMLKRVNRMLGTRWS
ncbi:hypothetical protein E0Z10_g8028 [Xylaria hypoxylon]|uniref:Uncharacterized protein n=1 Tax=Xylaria hypoxylon TaxID=37992 RepID=A0A4Z0YQL1_9PEZI|nr:hypothetical protein E0Z10_g8028 [Xylaria hypoxylon]